MRFAPDAVLWAPWFRRDLGFVNADLADDNLLLLQCSPAEYRLAGPSTRVPRQLITDYCRSPELAVWRAQTRFVLVGPEADGDDGPWPFNLPSDRSGLYTIGVEDLDEIVRTQDRGTINVQTLLALKEVCSPTVPDRPIVCPLEHELTQWPRAAWPRHRDPNERLAIRPHPYPGIFWMHAPSPIGLAFISDRLVR